MIGYDELASPKNLGDRKIPSFWFGSVLRECMNAGFVLGETGSWRMSMRLTSNQNNAEACRLCRLMQASCLMSPNCENKNSRKE